MSPAKGPRKDRINLSLDAELLAWVRANVGPGKRFGSVTHAVESGITLLRANEK